MIRAKSAAIKVIGLSTALAAIILVQANAGWAQMTTARPTETNPNMNAGAADPRAYLEDIDGARAMAWVKAHNEASLARLGKDPRLAQYQADMLKILQATDRIPMPAFAHGGMIDNFWQDADHVQGLLRRTTWPSYQTPAPKWDTLLDIDALSKAEGKNWVYRGAQCLPPDYNRCLVTLAEGGKDALVVREFDIKTKSFIAGGFDLPEGKQNVTWVDKDTIYVTREWTPGDVTSSGYAYITKRLKRGQPLDQAVEVFRGDKSDVSAGRDVLRDVDGRYVMDTSYRGLDFFHTELGFYAGDRKIVLPFPATTSFSAYLDGQAIFSLKDDWTSASGTVFHNGAVIAVDLKAALADPAKVEPVLLFMPNAHQSVDSISNTRHALVLAILSNVTGEIRSFTNGRGGWTSKILDLPANSTLDIQSADDESDHVFATATGFLMPATLYRADVISGKIEKIKS
ncbi:MAG: S9 family peptidase, partial [Asticcacaulis sp.]